ncbi:hypothetical protein F4604DRAFT_1885392 [Suillus subluteus]|nr:hypothetical protein F4604DRAFT_1885392 [Suillus subluteus]
MAPAVTRLVCQFPNCNRVFKNKSGLTQHTHAKHGTPQIQNLNRTAPLAGPGFIPPRSCSPTPAGVIDENIYDDPAGDQGFVPEEGTWVDMGRLLRTFHPHLTGLKCDANGAFIDQDAPPPPHTDAPPTDWMPYDNCVEFETAEFLFTRNQMSARQIDTLLDLWAATLIKHNDAPPFANHRDMYATIDATPLGDTPWKSFTLCYNGAKPEQDIPPWMDGQYDVWYRDPLEMTRGILANCDFNGGIEYSPYCDYTTEDKQYWKNFMSGDWAWKQADVIAQNEENHGSTFVPLIIGSDKTVVSVTTGQTDYHPLYLSIGNIHNTTKEHNDDIKYRNFRRQLFQRSLAKIFKSVKPFMENFDVTRFPDGHYQRTVYGLGPYIADYPEQILLSGVVQNWCPRCAWEQYGIIADLIPFTNDFPRADIHELLSPDILHQIIKGTFKDHLVDWQQLPHSLGCDDSKALMKVYLAAIEGHVPQDVVHTFSAFLEFCYTVRCEALTEDDLVKLQDALDRFHQYWEIFKTTGVVSTFSLPCQHSLCHYILMIQLFGAPNGLCSSITESKHIKAVKEPWCRSSRFNTLRQMLLTNQRLDKLAAARVDFEARGMLRGSCLSNALGVLRRPCINSSYVKQFAPGPFLTMNSLELDLPRLLFMIQEFIHDQHYSEDPNPPEFDPATAQVFLGKLTLFNSAAASFHAPSDLSGMGGMRREHIRATPSWHTGEPRHDCIFINMGVDFNSPMNGLAVARVLCFFSFNYRASYYPCAIVHWYSYVHKECDPDTGMYVVMPTTTGDDVPPTMSTDMPITTLLK